MVPDFGRKTIETVAKRAAFLCSNPECRASTVGPNDEADKATTVGEAAHVQGARPESARYDPEMSDSTRAEITNAIWLCRNCHRKVDQNPDKHSAELLFAWREAHEHFVAQKLGSPGERLRVEVESASLEAFRDCTPVIRRIVIDKPAGWEWRLTAELMRQMNRPVLRRLSDLQAGLYTAPLETVYDELALEWFSDRADEMKALILTLANLVPRLNAAWGPPGKPGDEEEIRHVCALIRDGLEQIAQHEERLKFVRMSDACRPVLDLARNVLAEQARRIAEIPNMLDDVVTVLGTDHGGTSENPRVLEKTITFELPEGWGDNVSREIKRLQKRLDPDTSKGSFWTTFLGVVIMIWLLTLIF